MTEGNEKMIVVSSNRRKKQSNRFIKPYFFNTLAPELNDSLMVHVSYERGALKPYLLMKPFS